MSTTRGIRSPAMVIACVALFVALGGTGYAALRLPANSVGSREIRNGSVHTGDLAPAVRARLDTPGPLGPQGPRGDTGATGPQGRDGAPVKDAVVVRFAVDEYDNPDAYCGAGEFAVSEVRHLDGYFAVACANAFPRG